MYVTVKKFCEDTGYTANAVYQKIQRGDWEKGQVWEKAPDGRNLINMEGYEKWVTETMNTR